MEATNNRLPHIAVKDSNALPELPTDPSRHYEIPNLSNRIIFRFKRRF